MPMQTFAQQSATLATYEASLERLRGMTSDGFAQVPDALPLLVALRVVPGV